MRPAIVHHRDSPEDAALVDLHSVVSSNAPDSTGTVRPCQVAMRAVKLLDLRAGQVRTIDGHLYPRPCQLVAFAEHVDSSPMSRGIYPDAATAMLKCLPTPKIDMQRDKLEVDELSGSFDQWRFLAAWFWSDWQDRHRQGDRWPWKRRWENLKLVGYPDTEPAFRQLCRRQGLLVTRSRP